MPIELYFVGAGKPATGMKPSSLKNISLNHKAMDWQLNSFKDVVEDHNIHFIGGYNIEEISKTYPHINYQIVYEWDKNSALHSLFHAPFHENPVLVSYTDTLFRNNFITKLS